MSSETQFKSAKELILSSKLKFSTEMADCNRYVPQTKVDWSANDAYQQFRLWRKEVERIINGPMAKDSDSIKLNTTYIWAGAYAETMVEAR